MDLTILIENIVGRKEPIVLPDGCQLECTEHDFDDVYSAICESMPVDHTVFKSYNARKGEWIVEICNSPRDYKTKPVWTGVFKRVDSGDLISWLNTRM